MNKKLLSLLLALVMVFSFIPAFAAEEAPAETDKKVEETEKAVEEAEEVAAPEEAETTPEFVKFLTDNGYVQGDKNNDLMLDKNLTRAQFATLLARLDGKDEVAKAMKTLGTKFTDVTEAHWAIGYINFAAGKAWVNGYPDGTFGPERDVTYAEIATVLVRYLGIDTMGFSYPVDYVAKAYEMGLMKGLPEIENHKQPATRKDMFQMLYNTISQKDFGKFNVYKMIVLENNRTSNLGETEVKAEVLSIVQQANNVDERGVAKIGEQKVFNLVRKNAKGEDEVIGDSEYLLGKVINATVNAEGQLVKVVVDKDNYKYLFGDLTKATEKQLGVNWSNYDVRIDERYYNRDDRRYDNDDRMYRTYVTAGNRSANYNYKEFAREVAAKRINPNFVRATVKDGMVMFIDTFAVRDIAPVADVKRDGKDVYYYNDMRNGSVDRMTPARRVIGFTAEKEFYNMKAEDIKKDDVIHMLEGVTLVRQDAKVEGKLEKTFVDADGEWAVIGEDEYWLSSVAGGAPEYLRSVYAYDDNHYRTTQNRGNINAMVGGDVKALLDIAGDIQLITSDKSFKDTIGMVKKWNSNYPVFYAANAEKDYNLDVVRDTDLVRNSWNGQKWNDTGVQREAEFKEFDILYTIGGEDAKAELLAGFIGRDEYADNMKPAKFEERFYRYLTVGGKQYRYDDDTKVFVVNGIDGLRAPYDFSDAYVVPATMADVAKYNEKNENLNAYVINEKQFREFVEGSLKINRYNLYGDREDLAKVVVFTNYVGPKADLTAPEYARVKRVYNYASSVTLEINRGEFVDFIVTNNADKAFLRSLKNGDVVVYQEVKDAKERTVTFPEKYNIPKASAAGRVESKGYIGQNGIITVDGHDFYTTKYTKVFGDINSRYAIVYATMKDADAIVYTDEPVDDIDLSKLTLAQKYQLGAFTNTVDAATKAVADRKPLADIQALVEAANNLYNTTIENDAKLVAAAAPKKAELDNIINALFPALKNANRLRAIEKELAGLTSKDVDKMSDKEIADLKAKIKEANKLGTTHPETDAAEKLVESKEKREALVEDTKKFIDEHKEVRTSDNKVIGQLSYDEKEGVITFEIDKFYKDEKVQDFVDQITGTGLIAGGKEVAAKHNVEKIAIDGSQDLDVTKDANTIKQLIAWKIIEAAGDDSMVNGLFGKSLACKVMIKDVAEAINVTVMFK